MAASQFSAFSVGQQLTGIGFHLDAGSNNRPLVTQNYTQWNLTLSSSKNLVGSLSTTFADNIGGDAVVVRSGALSLAPNTFTGGPGPIRSPSSTSPRPTPTPAATSW